MGTMLKLIAMFMKKIFTVMGLVCMCLAAHSQEEATFDIRTDEFSLMLDQGASGVMDRLIPVSFTRDGLATAALFVKGVAEEQCAVVCKRIHAFPATLEERNSVLSGMTSPESDVDLAAIPSCMCLAPLFE